MLTCCVLVFFFNDTAPTEIYTLSLHDALPILFAALLGAGGLVSQSSGGAVLYTLSMPASRNRLREDRKSTRLNSSHSQISYAVFCLKKKKCKTPANCTSQSAPDVTRPCTRSMF